MGRGEGFDIAYCMSDIIILGYNIYVCYIAVCLYIYSYCIQYYIR